jgi:hypothetical protein
MLDVTAPPTALDPTAPTTSPNPLDAIAEAYAAGDAPRAEHLFHQALDDGLPWTDVCSAAARGIALRYGEPHRA